jgi:Protein of unknown function (DUF4232)
MASIAVPRPLLAAGALLFTGILAGCGSASSGNAAGQASPSPVMAATGGGAAAGTGASARSASRATGGASPSIRVVLCQTASLTVTVDDRQGGGAAGSTYLPIDFANSSRSSCSMYGFPGVSFTSADGTLIGAPAARNTGFGNVLVTLRPGESAHVWLQVADARNYPAAACQPTTASVLRVYPPGNSGALDVHQSFATCRSASTPVLTVTSVRSGRGVQGTVP